ncbi:hypothetical protein NE237_028753 [Protea cynaroides]|uniref:adenine phosphoribosyltransferase n=1 Tax=Protea cynaroides TaxID=273540 RepID=A0A9Q0GPX3_9MAGN|nr:hypothetical protein NE237_028753 [Protea cynaroides]
MFERGLQNGLFYCLLPAFKESKLPSSMHTSLRRDQYWEDYMLEYGTDCLQMHVGAVHPGERAVIIDDLIITGGTLSAAIKLLEHVGAEVIECPCVVGLPEIKEELRLNGKPLYILVEPRQ